MKTSLDLRLDKLEEDRLLLREKRKRVSYIFLIAPFVFLTVYLFSLNIEISSFATFITLMILWSIYFDQITLPFQKLKYKLRESLLTECIKTYFPGIQYTFYPTETDGAEIIQDSNLMSADIYDEEDVIIGSMKDTEFYLSEVDLRQKTKKSSYSIFRGILFRIRIPGKNFPHAQIQSDNNLLNRLFNDFKKNEEYGFWYESNNDDQFDASLQSLFPFIRHLMKDKKNIRIKTFGDEITIMMESDIKFLDDPKPQLNKSFKNKEYYHNIMKQINSLLYIVESFTHDLATTEIEQNLELKMIEYSSVLKQI